jgi:hypothetical protein
MSSPPSVSTLPSESTFKWPRQRAWPRHRRPRGEKSWRAIEHIALLPWRDNQTALAFTEDLILRPVRRPQVLCAKPVKFSNRCKKLMRR